MRLFTRLSPRERWFLYLGIIAILGVISYLLIIEPAWTSWKGLNKSIYDKERGLLKNIKIMAQKDLIDKYYDKYAQSLKMKGSVEEETAVILSEIENIGRSSNVEIIDIKPHRVQEMDFYKEYFIELEAEGNITNLAKFIYELQNSKQILKVRHLRLNAKGTSDDVLKSYLIVTKILIP